MGKPLTANAMAHMLTSAASALNHGRWATAKKKVAEVNAVLNPTKASEQDLDFADLGIDVGIQNQRGQLHCHENSMCCFCGSGEHECLGCPTLDETERIFNSHGIAVEEHGPQGKRALTNERGLTNERRAGFGAAAVRVGTPDFGQNDSEHNTDLVDTLANLMHYAKLRAIQARDAGDEWDFSECVLLAEDHFQAETCRDPNCMEYADDGEGFDGYCGKCADKRDPEKELAKCQ